MCSFFKECGRKLLDALLEGNDTEATKWLKQNVDFTVECVGLVASQTYFLKFELTVQTVGYSFNANTMNT